LPKNLRQAGVFRSWMRRMARCCEERLAAWLFALRLLVRLRLRRVRATTRRAAQRPMAGPKRALRMRQWGRLPDGAGGPLRCRPMQYHSQVRRRHELCDVRPSLARRCPLAHTISPTSRAVTDARRGSHLGGRATRYDGGALIEKAAMGTCFWRRSLGCETEDRDAIYNASSSRRWWPPTRDSSHIKGHECTRVRVAPVGPAAIRKARAEAPGW
jgi:hypothetical protein